MTLRETRADLRRRRPLIDVVAGLEPLVGHCDLCERLVWLSGLEAYVPGPGVVGMRCRTGCRLADLTRRQEVITTQTPVALIEEPDGTVRLTYLTGGEK